MEPPKDPSPLNYSSPRHEPMNWDRPERGIPGIIILGVQSIVFLSGAILAVARHFISKIPLADLSMPEEVGAIVCMILFAVTLWKALAIYKGYTRH